MGSRNYSGGRRRFLRTQLVLGGGLAVCPVALLHATPEQVKDAEQRLGKFFSVSQKLLSPLPLNTRLDERVAIRLLAALNSEYPSFPQQLDLFPDNPGPGEMDSPVALLIVSAWYLGVVGKQLVTYERALMYRLTADVLVPRSYCDGKPGAWASAPKPNLGRV
ncbi:sugar dehydrogenase complex small subunit [uncultured Microbulbifer sp.]|uniref:sugar dehydrogenase complex small subunit n=1 Tax=uncultured Microbulbifer sp. TaxID=348147 RepID=UPI00260A7132|nr:sugar dehydrogenase complex small subunit [uncultured Microbulbifer sp.]